MFKIGDYVLLQDSVGLFDLELWQTYKVKHTKINYKGDQLIAFSEEDEDLYNEIPYYNSKRFTMNIRPIRKQKLQKIFNNEAI